MKSTLVSFLVLVGALGAGACGSSGGGGEQSVANADEGVTLDMNDVSLLFPLADPQGLPQSDELLSVRAPGKGGPLLSDEAFQAVLGAALLPGDRPLVQIATVPVSFGDPSNWKVVGVRADDCAKLRADAPGCIPQLRLVAQLLERQADAAQDQTLHLVYNLAPADFDELVADLLALKASSSVPTNGAPLGVHPAMAAEGAAGPFAAALKGVIAKHVGQPNLFAVAAMLTLRNGDPRGTEWRFSNGVFQNGTFVQPPLPCVDPSLKSVSVFGSGLSNALSAPPTCADAVNEMVDSHAGGAFLQRTPEEQQAAVDAQLRTENPNVTQFQQSTCLGCHVGGRALARVKGFEFLEAGFDQNPNRFVPEAGIATAFRSGRRDPNQAEPDDSFDLNGPYEVRAFGYLSDLPSYTMRTVNETAHVVAALNKRLAETPPAPGPAPALVAPSR
jgi:hypothetical protein